MNLAVSNTTLIFAALLVFVALYIGYREKLGVDKDIIIGVVRAIIQLVVVGYLLKYVFRINNVWLTLILILIIIFNAAYNANKRAAGIRHALPISLLAILSSTGLTLAVLVFSGSIRFIPSQMIPISGMIASNSMVAIGLCYRNMNSSFRDRRQQVLERLALGADLRLASIDIVRESIRTGMAPTIDSAKTVGIVSLPGMMSGLIFAGVDPVHAIKYQILVTFMLLSATSIGSVIACYLAYKQFYNEQKQLL
ncbi:iron export ABC transporter permease subunit FetB [Loigolactobacillus coryniformis]|jgi:putative ABC transport system permease protein|uniref:ABC transporter, permease protein n=3 Tax=Loigolactobacillus coryniformis TaxID=1610 RepID=J3JBM2_9LACO|nr:iron export ABC transporter permease subunit FetB [Loigolactobacillus coryniformis]MDT3391659.1 iron export ABC transporter permease subunit FetB [Bacillota bacterium]RRG03048.1 MAG: iron export ABC transporter permease subunit FetB [Lactobacillus sp.]ATO54949.1 iron export ABC transporter permease subunit FetB [Loigolactobacillus coryniformis subsp. coryniformis KCTC 3167 = DSM 20001]EJN55847.1 ABC transporter, permease protein [Loigolactobacillus coryniformis subsp. coryniformis CECT 5711]